MGKTCSHCGEEIIKQYKNCKGSLCRKCRCRYEWEKTLLRKIKVVELMGGKCSICGYDKYYGSLTLHHKDREEKEMDWKEMRVCSWDNMMKEVEKCILVCRNCHGEIEAKDAVEFEFEHKNMSDIQKESKEKRKRICPICNKEFVTSITNTDQIYCSVECFGISNRKVERPTKEILQQEIKNMSWLEMSRKYGVSDNAVRKWAKKYGIKQ